MHTDRKYAFLGMLTISICVLALYIYRHRQGKTGRIDDLLITATGHLQRQSYYLIHGTRTLSEHYLLLVNVKRRNEELERETAGLRAKIAELEEVRLENDRLRESLRFEKEVDRRVLAANVIAHDVSSDYVGIRIDKGARDGVNAGLGVVSSSGVVGRVLRVTEGYADILTLLDPTSNLDAIVQRSRSRGIVSGQARELNCRLKYLDRLEDVAVNDTVVSSGFGNIFPEGLLVGYVTAVIPNPNSILQSVTVKPAVDVYRLEEVFIVLPRGEPEKTT